MHAGTPLEIAAGATSFVNLLLRADSFFMPEEKLARKALRSC